MNGAMHFKLGSKIPLCIICGKPTRIKKYAGARKALRTCSDECLAIHYKGVAENGRKHIDYNKTSSRMRDQWRNDEVFIKAMSDRAAVDSERLFNVEIKKGKRAAGVDHFHSKRYWLVSPKQIRYEFKNLRHFVRNNAHLFDRDEVIWVPYSNGSGTIGRVQCKALRLYKVLRGERGSWKGWRGGELKPLDSIARQY